MNVTTCCLILSVMGDIAAHLNNDTKDRIVADLMTWLKTFSLRLEVSKKTILLVESLLIPVKPAEYQEELPASLPLSQFKQNSMPTRVKAHGVLALGKLCLQHEDLIPKYLPVLARELEVGTDVSVRNNIVMVMCDLCIRCTNMAVHYIPNISACLRDDNSVIREQTLIMLTNLLQEEYVKWKGSLFFRFVVALVDPVPTIASLCEYCLLHRLLKKNPEMFSQHFIECMFHFNSYGKHKSYNKFPQTEREKIRFSLKGAKHHDKRFRIYRFLLKSLLEQKRSPVLRDLMDYLKVLMKDNHTEVKELLGDEQLVAEVEFALKTENERLMQQLMDGPRPLEPFRFATPQQKRLNFTSTRKTRSDCHVPPSGPEKPVPSKSVALDGTGMTTRAINNRAFSTPDGTRLTLTFNEGLSTILSDPGSIAEGST
uniref:Non-SMC condensin II complex, subunit D3 n=1 Tax=Nothobranchius kuhntae TaxID=321403 RepID=A0A1A8IYV9_NOTKU